MDTEAERLAKLAVQERERVMRMRAIAPSDGTFIAAGKTWSPPVRPVGKRKTYDRAALKVARKASRAARRAQRRRTWR